MPTATADQGTTALPALIDPVLAVADAARLTGYVRGMARAISILGVHGVKFHPAIDQIRDELHRATEADAARSNQ